MRLNVSWTRGAAFFTLLLREAGTHDTVRKHGPRIGSAPRRKSGALDQRQ